MSKEYSDKFLAEVDKLAKIAIRERLLIEVGFLGFRKFAISREASPAQIADMRLAFFAGAQHLLGAISSTMDPDAEPTPDDIQRMEDINAELEKFAETLDKLMEQNQ